VISRCCPVLIVNCDDFGLYEAVNPAVLQAVEEGIASSCM
jgi:predicted glycoside hydrolase/deacetylase ChbG (UPF0249 family)